MRPGAAFLAISSWKPTSTAARAREPSVSATATEIECSEDPCEVRITFTPTLASASMNLSATPWVP